MLINNLIIITNSLITFTVPRTSRKRGPIRRRCMRSAASTPSRAAKVSTHLARRRVSVRRVLVVTSHILQYDIIFYKYDMRPSCAAKAGTHLARTAFVPRVFASSLPRILRFYFISCHILKHRVMCHASHAAFRVVARIVFHTAYNVHYPQTLKCRKRERP